MNSTSVSPFLIFISIVSALGGFLFGYDWVLVGGAKPFYEAYFGITEMPSMQGWVMGSAIVGCLLGVMVSGSLADKYGRKPLLMVSAVVFLVAAIGTGAVSDITSFIICRIVGGVGIGIASNLSPMYIAEVAPTKTRGRFVSIYQLTIVFGILSAQITNWLIAEPVLSNEDILASWNGQMGWRWMFWAGTIPALLFVLTVFFIPESPRWLTSVSRYNDAESVLTRIGGSSFARREVNEMRISAASPIKNKKIDIRPLFEGRMPRILMIGVVIAAFQQWCGINVIFNYAQEIFASAGYDVSDILFNIVITGVTNVIFTIVGMYAVDRLGRRALLLLGSIGLACIYGIMGAFYCLDVKGLPVLILVVIAIACYAMTLAPIVWVVLSEIYPTRIRGMAMAISTFSLWTACFILTFTFPLLNNWLGSFGTFWLYGIICVLGFIFIKTMLPETKGKSLEEIEREIIS